MARLIKPDAQGLHRPNKQPIMAVFMNKEIWTLGFFGKTKSEIVITSRFIRTCRLDGRFYKQHESP